MAFEAIHSLNVLHGDIRAENILVSSDGMRVYVIDFEWGTIVDKDDPCIMGEKNELIDLLKNFPATSVR